MRLINSFKYAWQGIKHCFVSEKNFRIQMIIAVEVIICAVIFKISAAEWVVILFSSGLVLSLEMVNTSVEKLSNVVAESFHPVIKQVKDIAAGAVCLVSVISIIIACIIFLPKFLALIKQY